jgi:hypothetical protein
VPRLAGASETSITVEATLPSGQPPGRLRVTVPALANDTVAAHLTLLGTGGPFRDVDWNNAVISDFELYGGTRTVGRVPAGPWQVVVSTADGRTWKGSATVIPGGTAEAVLK